MEIDPAALSRTNINPRASETPSISIKALPNANNTASKANKAAPAIPRVDYEPFYTEIKSLIGDHWGTYKDAISQFLIGYLNYTELSTIIAPFIHSNVNHEHLHNQLVCAIYANLSRDVPESTVAGWVSANDKPTNVPKPAAGDAAEQRLKSEVKQLPPRIRHRIKSIRDDPHRPLTQSLHFDRSAFSLPHHNQPVNYASSSVTASSADPTSSTGLNRDLEIRRRYNLPLISETHDLPTISSLTDRISPICYEEGLSSGLGPMGETVSEFLDIALGIFLKDTLTTIVSLTRADAPVSGPRTDTGPTSTDPNANITAGLSSSSFDPTGSYGTSLDRSTMGIMTAHYKRTLASEETLWAQGKVKRNEAGLLPIEVASANRAVSKHKGISAGLRVAWETEDTTLRDMMPWLGDRLAYVWGDDEEGEGPDVEKDDSGRHRQGGLRPPGTSEKREKEKHRLGGAGGTLGIRGSNIGSNSTGNATNGINGILTNGVNGHAPEDVDMLEEQDWGWQGAKMADRKMLADLLDDCLNIEQ